MAQLSLRKSGNFPQVVALLLSGCTQVLVPVPVPVANEATEGRMVSAQSEDVDEEMGQEGNMPGMGSMAESASPFITDELAPLVMVFYQGEEIFFVHTEASDADVAGMLTEMMGPQVVAVPALAEIPADLLGTIYVFTNGVAGMGPMGFQPDIFTAVPGDLV